MKIAILSDIHGNKDALDAVVKDIPDDVANYWCLGDTIGYGPEPNECLDFVQSVCTVNIKGNHEQMFLEPENDKKYRSDVMQETQWTRKKIIDKDKTYIEELPEKVEIGNKNILVHGGFPDHIWSYTQNSQDALRAFDYFEQRFCFIGHTHKPVVWALGMMDKVFYHLGKGTLYCGPDARMIVNVGSVGQPRDGNPDASYVIFDDEEDGVEFRRVKYDIKSVQKKIEKARLPAICGERLAVGR